MSSILMKQSSASALPPQTRSSTTTAVSRGERYNVLCEKNSNKVVMNIGQKKDFFLVSVLPMRDELLSRAQSLDAIGSTSNMHLQLKALLPSSKTKIRKDWTNDILANRFLDLFDDLQHLSVKIKEQQYASAQASTVTRSSSDRMSRDPVIELFEKMQELIRKVDEVVIRKRTQQNIWKEYKQPTLSPSQQNRKWSKDRVPVLPNMRYCVMCGHESINEPVENEKMEEKNRVAYEKRDVDIVLWNMKL